MMGVGWGVPGLSPARLPDDVQRGLSQVGSLGWDTSVEANGQAVDVVSVGRDQDSLWFLEYHQ